MASQVATGGPGGASGGGGFGGGGDGGGGDGDEEGVFEYAEGPDVGGAVALGDDADAPWPKRVGQEIHDQLKAVVRVCFVFVLSTFHFRTSFERVILPAVRPATFSFQLPFPSPLP